jgi:hypothetical protein
MPGIHVGDAVIDLFVNLASLDELESRMGVLPSKAASASTSVSGSLDGIAKSATGAGNQAAVAGEKIAAAGKVGASGLNVSGEAVQQLQAKIKQLEVELSVLQEKFGQVGPKASSSMREARGTLALLGEDVGIRLPRHLQTFVAGIPGVSGALAAGFAPIAVLTLIDVIDKIPAKIAELEDYFAHFGAAEKAAFEGHTTGLFSQLQVGIDLLKEQTLQEATAGKAGVDATKAQIKGLGEYQHELGIAQENLKKFQDALDHVKDTKITEFPLPPVIGAPAYAPITQNREIEEKGKEELKKQFEDFVKYAQGLQDQFHIYFPHPTLPPLDASAASLAEALGKYQKEVSAKLTEFSNQQAQIDQEKKKLAEDIQRDSLDRQAAILKTGLDVQLSSIDRFKENVRTAYLSGKADSIDWALAQVKATQEATKAHEDYLVKLEAVYRKAGDSAKVQETAEQLRVFQTQAAAKAVGLMNDSIQKETDGISKLKGELADAQVAGFAKNLQQAAAASVVLKDAQDKLIKAEQELATARAHGNAKEQAAAQSHLTEVTLEGDAAVKKATKDFEDAAKAAQALANAQRHLEESALRVTEAEKQIAELQLVVRFREQEQAIDRLAEFAVISEEKKDRRLRKLYEDERIAAIAEIDKELQQRQKKLDAAQANFNEAKNNPIFSESQKKEAEANLNDALAAYKRLASEKLKIDSEFDNKQLTQQRGYLAQALNLALAAGKREIADQLLLKQHELDETRVQIEQAKARGENTKKLQEQEREIQRTIRTIGQEVGAVGTLRRAWDIFSQDYKKKTTDDEAYAQQLAQSMQTVAQGLQDGIEGAFAAMVSGSESAGQALEASAFSTIGSIAEQWGAFFLAKAIGDLWINPAASAGEFAAGAALEALAGVMKGLSGAIGNSGTSSGSSSAGTTGPEAGSTAATAAPQPIQVQNVQHFMRGALVSKKMPAIIGDGPGGGDADEAIIPLDDERATRRIAGAFLTAVMASHPSVNAVDRARIIARAPQLSDELANPQIFTLATRRAAAQAVEAHRVESDRAQSREHSMIVYETHENHYHTHIKGDLVDYKQVAAKVSKPLSDGVKSGKFRLTSSTAFRQTKRG